jgi:pimeloyl-ACP methyl ester carboxylesterase
VTDLLESPYGEVEFLVSGSGAPVTVFGHGMTSSIAQTRPFGSGVPGTRVYLHFAGHGRTSVPPQGWSYAALAGQLRAVADEVGATRALGVSLGSHALLSLIAQTPDRFDRLVFVLPAGLDTPAGRPERLALADRIEARDVEGIAALLRGDQPAAVRDLPAVRLWARRRADELAGSALAVAAREVPPLIPLPQGLGVLQQVLAPALVLVQGGDEVHPVAVGARLAAALPNAELVELAPGGVLWRDRDRLREVVSGFLSR